jgi:hypothetical protein
VIVSATCACRKSNPNILMMQSAEDWAAKMGEILRHGGVNCAAGLIGWRADIIREQKQRTPAQIAAFARLCALNGHGLISFF